MEVRSDDVWVVTFPKCGTTWMQAIVWNLVTNCDEQLKDVPMQVSHLRQFSGLSGQVISSIQFAEEVPIRGISMRCQVAISRQNDRGRN